MTRSREMARRTTILIFPGLEPPYLANVRVDCDRALHFVGTDGTAEGRGPTIIDGAGDAAIRVVNTDPQATTPTSFEGLTLRGFQGITSSVDLDLRDLVFEGITAEALALTGGSPCNFKTDSLCVCLFP